MVRSKINKINLLTAFSITALIFFSGFYLNTLFTKSKLSELKELQDFLDIEGASIEVQYDLALENLCSTNGLSKLNNDLNSFGDKLTYIEGVSPKDDMSVNNLYTYYTVLEAKHFLFINRVNKECSADFSTILYFYSPIKSLCASCDTQGITLTAVKKELPSTMVYSFNTNSKSKVVATLKQLYNITVLPTVVINNEKFEGFMSRREIESKIIDN